jgi:hypothetical protein
VFDAATAKAGVTDTTPYWGRHTYASMHLAAGENPLLVAASLGHGPDVLYRRYAHAVEGAGGSSVVEEIERARRQVRRLRAV